MAPEITAEFVWSHLPKRPRESNKGSFGAVLAVAGSACYRGAASLTVEGALRTGAGIVTLASVEPVLAAVSARLPECCLCPCEPGAEGGISPQSIPRILRQKAAVLLIGPGLGYLAQSTARAAETRTLVKRLLTGFSGSAVLDADGLNAAASLMNAGEELPRPAKELILTPHPGEMSRLTGLSVEAVQADREGVARRYAAQWNAVVVLKGRYNVSNCAITLLSDSLPIHTDEFKFSSSSHAVKTSPKATTANTKYLFISNSYYQLFLYLFAGIDINS